MKISYLVQHEGVVKKFEQKLDAMKHAGSLANLGYPVEVYELTQTLFVEVKTLLYTANCDAFKRSFEKWQSEQKQGLFVK